MATKTTKDMKKSEKTVAKTAVVKTASKITKAAVKAVETKTN